MNNTKNLFVTQNEKLLCIKGTEHLFSVCRKTSDFITETVAENIEEKTAHLFAAAPDLLSALERLLKISQEELNQSATHDGLVNCEALANARVAIAKAKGAL
jgi:hypothetical protein